MTQPDAEKVRDALASVYTRYISDGYYSYPALVTDTNEAFLDAILEAARAWLAAQDKEEGE